MKTLIATFAVFLLLFLPLTLQARRACSDNDIEGGWGLFATGEVILPPGLPITGPFTRVGRVVADGAGKATFSSMASYNGLIFPEPVTGTYKVNSDCTMTWNILVPDPVNLPATLNGVITDDGREASFLIVSTPGTTIFGTLRRQKVHGCNASYIEGGYQIDFSGRILGTSPQAGPYRRIGRAVFDGGGKFSASTSASYNGAIASENFTGTYAVDFNCKFTMSFTLPGAASATSMEGVVTDKFDNVYLIQTTLGTVISGTLKRQ